MDKLLILFTKAAVETDINLYNAFNENAGILNFKMAAVTGQISRGTDPKKFL